VRVPEDNMMGRLSALQRRLEAEPLPELFDAPIKTWLPATPGRGHGIEIEHLLDHALASAIKGGAMLPATRLWQWTKNVRDYAWSRLGDQTAAALAGWLDETDGREAAFFDAILAEDDPTKPPSTIGYHYAITTRRDSSAAVIGHLLTRAAANSARAGKRRLLALAVDLARRSESEAYWEAYDRVDREPGCKRLLKQLTTDTIDRWRRQQQARTEKARRREAKVRAKNVRLMASALSEMQVGGKPHHLAWAARLYFEGDPGAGFQRVAHLTDDITIEAILAGWEYLATRGLGDIDAAQLGRAEAESRSEFVEWAAVAGVDRLISENRVPTPSTMPLEVAIAVLKSSWVFANQERRSRVEKWAVNRLNVDPIAGAAQLLCFWAQPSTQEPPG
jgi:hypothetical protein